MEKTAAPKDPVKLKEFFYIMYDKQVAAVPSGSGKGVCCIYEDGDRMTTAARLMGNVTDESMLSMLKSAEGFKKLVYGIGVSMINSEGVPCDFAFQMYGKSDVNRSGTTFYRKLTADGVESIIPFTEIDWSDDDDKPGQIRFEFEEQNLLCTVNVRLFLNDGYKAPEFEESSAVDFSSEAYRRMIDRSLLNVGDTYRIKKAIEKARRGEEVYFCFIGGSITQGAGATPINTECYPYLAYRDFADKYGRGDNVKYVKAGVGGTPSEFGIVRYERDVSRFGKVNPDIVVVEFAVNDNGDETGGDCYEGLVRHILSSPGEPAVILLFSVFADDSNLEERFIPIGMHYGLPMTSIREAVKDQFYLSEEEGRVIPKSRFFYDCYHPCNAGHRIMADCIGKLIDESEKAETTGNAGEKIAEPLRTADFSNVRLLDRGYRPVECTIECTGFEETDKELHCAQVDMSTEAYPQFPDNWKHVKGSKGCFRISLKCRTLIIVIKNTGFPSGGAVDVFDGDRFVRSLDSREFDWIHCNPRIIVREEKASMHDIRICMREGDEDKDFTILGFGVEEI